MTALKNAVNTFLLQKQQKFSLELIDNIQFSSTSNLAMALAMQVNVESLSFAFQPPVIHSLAQLDNKSLSKVWSFLNKELLTSVGAHRLFQPMYPNFPEQTMKASDLELLTNQLAHYTGDWLGFRILPIYEKQARLPLVQNTQPRKLSLASEYDIDTLFINLLSANTSLSDTDKAGVKTLINYYHEEGRLESILARARIVQKETLAIAGANMVGKVSLEHLSEQFSSVNDVLRLVVAINEGDVSLSANTKFKNMSRPMRREIMSLIEKVVERSGLDMTLENAATYRNQWVRLGERIHPQEMAKNYEKSAELFQALRNNTTTLSFNAKIDSAFARQDLHETIGLLSQRPGVFARNLNRLFQHIEGHVPLIKEEKSNALFNNDFFNPLTKFDNRAEYGVRAMDAFTHATSKISTPVLLQVMNYFENQGQSPYRAFLPKGAVSKSYVLENEVPALSLDTRVALSSACRDELVSRFAQLPEMGRVYVSPELAGYPVPFALRSASKALNTVTRGSQMAIDEANDTTRFFIWWREPKNESAHSSYYYQERVDIDLSVVFLDENFERVSHCSFTNLRGKGFSHSGDITSAPNGACEFIDINRSELDPRIQYATMVINSYTHHNYCDLPECFAGWMERCEPQQGEIFDPKTVQNKIDLTSESQMVMPMIVDVKNSKVIWADLAMGGDFWNMVESQNKKITHMVKTMVHLNKPNLYDLFTMHASARGVLVETKEEADVIFSPHEGVTPYQLEVIGAEYMVERPETANTLKMKV